jgi:short subunit dehydrogenase-like uncharacterized protein
MGTSAPLLVYGAYGYTGELVVAEALAAGVRPIVAGRDAKRVDDLARVHELEGRSAPLDDPLRLDAALEGVRVVLHCAGPFIHTSRPMLEACLRRGVHYLDITGELAVFEAVAARGAAAKDQGVTLLPGVGFDVVPSDCLAAHLAGRLPGAVHLALAIRSRGGISRGTATTVAENFGAGGAIRRDGKITRVPAAYRSRWVDFGDGRRTLAVTIPWGDVSTAWHSTGIPNVEVFMAMTPWMRRGLVLSRFAGPLLRSRRLRKRLMARMRSLEPGPGEADRARGETRLWGEVRDDAGGVATSILIGPEGYTLTARTAVAAAVRVLEGGAETGFQTPSRAFGADFIMDQPGVRRMDVT